MIKAPKNMAEVVQYFMEGNDELLLLLKMEGQEKEYVWKDRVCKDELFDVEIAHLERVNNEENRVGIYFYPNRSYKNLEVTDIGWHFVDIDDGPKNKQWERILNAPLEPTIVYRGRRGHKLLYKIENSNWDNSNLIQSINHFKDVELALINYFGGDYNVINPARGLRLPYTYNYKKRVGGKFALEKVVLYKPDNVYFQKELQDAFAEYSVGTNAKKLTYYKQRTLAELPAGLREVIDMFMEYLEQEGYKYTLYQDHIAFNCPIHDDEHPSGFMFFSEFNGELWVHCSAGANEEYCEIGAGKPLSWVADYLGWIELSEICRTYEDKLLRDKYGLVTLDRIKLLNQTRSVTLGQRDSEIPEGIIINELKNLSQKGGR